MEIPSQFYQFTDEKALVIVSGTEEAKLFGAHDGEMDHLETIKTRKISYSDREGFFASRGQGKTFGAGSVMEDVDEKERKEFRDLLGEKYAEMADGYDYVALLAPEHALPEIIGSLGIPKDKIEDKVKIIKKGIFLDYSPEKLLELLTEGISSF